ncbi:uncharacterized Zn finger protein (UPF0148 family) [Kitasatospora sp. MAA4]|nr:uncharacterized Zn finger protein (UPF0148 family) [Kitasatospora sp. MAA4]
MPATVAHSRYCPMCGTPVKDGPAGGFVCPQCNHVQEPPGAHKARKEAARARAERVAAAAQQREEERQRVLEEARKVS